MTMETFQNILENVCLVALAISLAALAVVALRRAAESFIKQLTVFWHSLTAFGRVAVVSFALVCFLYGGGKTNLPLRIIRPLRGLARSAAAVQRVDAHFFASNWNRRGAWRDSLKLDFDGEWLFPWGDGHLSSVEVMSWGEIRPGCGDTNVIADIGVPIAIVPGLTEFSVEATESNSYLFAWTNAAVNRYTNNLVSASIELKRCGDIIVTTNGVSRIVPRVLPFAHDGFGQDAEWVAANFSNATEIAETGYAAWVDAQVGHGLENGLYKFAIRVADDPPETINLVVGDLSIAVTNAGEYAFLLEKGIRYDLDATSDVATNFVYTVTDDMQAPRRTSGTVRTAPAMQYGIWSRDSGRPVVVPPPKGWIIFTPKLNVMPERWQPSWLAPSRTFRAQLTDVRSTVNADYSWRSHGAAVGIASVSSQEATVSCAFPYDDEGMIELSLEAVVAGQTLDVNYRCPVSRYNSGDWVASWEASGTNIPPVGVRVSAMPDFVFFDAIDPQPLVADVTCSYCVENAGTITLNIVDQDSRTIQDSFGNVVTNGYTWSVDGRSFGARFFMVTGAGESSSATGTVLRANYAQEGGASLTSDAASVTFAKITTRANWLPEPAARRELGVREPVTLFLEPAIAGVSVDSLSESSTVVPLQSEGPQYSWSYIAPAVGGVDTVFFSTAKSVNMISFTVYEPTGYEVLTVQPYCLSEDGLSGACGMIFNLQLTPTNVSFNALDVFELGLVSTNATGYFTAETNTNWLDHAAHGANVWKDVATGLPDVAGCAELPPPWGDGGAFSWPIPNYWRIHDNPACTNYFCNTDQSFALDSDGTVRVCKFGYVCECNTNRSCHVELEVQR